ncbi:DUF4170 domain-containing protein [Sphingomicrobium clamense]|uniref:DUF4170 domain-containing protein n=1 Tax=Sphingomicrobium clamense TaxID=2851013 RepID=A0ABS6V2Z8_9SPHN|nr:hypothetical protein [Sphingomicrobium sp. B8]MBW0143904.1 hypothetical protein [Sphingomicrobium sp. B8]
MNQQLYWVVGGDYADADFTTMIPETARVAGPFADAAKAKKEWTRLTFNDNGCRSATTRYAIATGTTVLPR